LSKTIIIVDNDPAVLSNYADFLRPKLVAAGADVVMMDSPQAVLDHVAAHGHPFAVLSDNNMDEMDGTDLALALRKAGYRGRFVLLTGLPEKAQVTEGTIDVILEKPAGVREIRKALAFS